MTQHSAHQADALDLKLLRLLRKNARRPNSELAQEVGLSPSACLRRIRLLEERGVIRGYTAIVEAPGAGDEMIAIVRLTLEKQTEEYLRRFEAAVREHPEIQECFLMTGDVDYMLKVSIPSARVYEAVHTDVLSRLPGVSRIHSSFAMRDVLRETHAKTSRSARG